LFFTLRVTQDAPVADLDLFLRLYPKHSLAFWVRKTDEHFWTVLNIFERYGAEKQGCYSRLVRVLFEKHREKRRFTEQNWEESGRRQGGNESENAIIIVFDMPKC